MVKKRIEKSGEKKVRIRMWIRNSEQSCKKIKKAIFVRETIRRSGRKRRSSKSEEKEN